MRDKKVDAINTSVAVKAVWACDGRSRFTARVHRDRGRGAGED